MLGGHPLGQDQREEDGEAEDEEVPRRVEIDKLQVGEADRGDDAKHDGEDPSNDRVGDGDHEGGELGEDPEEDHDGRGPLDHPPAAHLERN